MSPSTSKKSIQIKKRGQREGPLNYMLYAMSYKLLKNWTSETESNRTENVI